MLCGCVVEGCFEGNCPMPPMDGDDICVYCDAGNHL